MPEGFSIARLRRLLLAILGLALVVLVVLLAVDREPPEPASRDDAPSTAAGGDLVMSGEGFQYDYTRGGRVVLELRGERMLSDREDNVVLEGVTIRVHREEEEGDVAAGEEPGVRTWVIRSRTANYNLVSEHAELEGRVSVVGPDGVSLESERVLVDRGERVEIPVPVVLRMPRGEDLAYAARGQRGSYDLRRDQAELTGRALVVACEAGTAAARRRDHALCAGGASPVLELASARFEVHAGSRIVAPGAVRFRYRDLAGRAGSLIATLERQVYRLDDGVEVEAVGPLAWARTPLTLAAERLLFERRERLVRALGGVDLRAGADRLQGRRLGVQLAADERTVESIQVRGSVLATRDGSELPGSAPPPRSALFGDRLFLLFEVTTGDPTRLQLDGMEGRPAVLQSTDAGVAGSFVRAPVFHGRFEDGVLRRVEAPGPVGLEERLLLAGSERVAWACGERAEATLADGGELAFAALEGRVESWREGWHASAHSARFAGGLGRGELVGAPEEVDPRRATSRVRLLRADGAELLAPRLVLEPAVEAAAAGEGGAAPLRWHAQGGVRGFVPAGAGLSLGDAPAPVRVEADEGLFHTDGRRVVLRGEARVHQGRNALIAERIEGDLDRELLAADGGVSTFWEDEETARRAAAEASRPPPAPIPLPGPAPPALRLGPGPLPPPGVQWIPEALRPPTPAPAGVANAVADTGEEGAAAPEGEKVAATEPDDEEPPPPTRYFQPAPSPVVPGRLEIRSERMTLYRRSGQLLYVDDVYARQDAISIRCQELEVLEPPGRGSAARLGRRLDCRHDVRVDDADAKRVIEGEFARYCEGEEEIRVWGDRVVMRGAPGRAVDGTPIVGAGGRGALIECPAMIYRRGGDARCIERAEADREGCGW